MLNLSQASKTFGILRDFLCPVMMCFHPFVCVPPLLRDWSTVTCELFLTCVHAYRQYDHDAVQKELIR